MPAKMKKCPFCGEDIELNTMTCPYCSETLPVNRKSGIKFLKVIGIIILAALIGFVIYYVYSIYEISKKAESYNNEQQSVNSSYAKAFIKTVDNLNNGIVMQTAIDTAPDTPVKIEQMMNTRFTVKEVLPNNTFILGDGTSVKIKYLNSGCDEIPTRDKIGESTACTEITVDTNNKNGPNTLGIDQYILYSYPNGIVPLPDSTEEKILSRK